MDSIEGDLVQLFRAIIQKVEQRLADIVPDVDLVAVRPRLQVHDRDARVDQPIVGVDRVDDLQRIADDVVAAVVARVELLLLL